jgi:hypothetical protein
MQGDAVRCRPTCCPAASRRRCYECRPTPRPPRRLRPRPRWRYCRRRIARRSRLGRRFQPRRWRSACYIAGSRHSRCGYTLISAAARISASLANRLCHSARSSAMRFECESGARPAGAQSPPACSGRYGVSCMMKGINISARPNAARFAGAMLAFGAFRLVTLSPTKTFHQSGRERLRRKLSGTIRSFFLAYPVFTHTPKMWGAPRHLNKGPPRENLWAI